MSTINRKPHIIKREKTLVIPRHFLFFDTETTQIVNDDKSIRQVFKLGWACYYRRAYGRHQERHDWFFIDTPVSFWTFVFGCSKPKQKLWLIARNVVFDFTVLDGWTHLKREGYKLKFFHNNGVTAIVSVRKKGSSLVFLDSMNWFVESLAKTGERIGIPKMEINFKTCSDSELSVYCKNDVLIELENFKSFIRFLESNSISRVCYTRASTAMAAYLFRHYHTPIYIHNNAQAIKLERESYKGGRCECFYIGDLTDENYYMLDVNSLYPFVMRNSPYPTKYKKFLRTPDTESLNTALSSGAVVAKVLIDTDEPLYAIKRNRTIFPIGKFVATLCTPELKYALAHGHIKTVYSIVTYEQAKIFTSYVDTFYAMRQRFRTDNVPEYVELCKKLLNSLYGKFGQKGEQWVKIGDAPDEPDREELIFRTHPRIVTRLRYLLGEVFELKGYNESFDSFPAIAAHVTAYGRMHLWSLMQQAGHDNYFYCDTDSLIVNETGLNRLRDWLSDTKLGYIKVEDTTTSLHIRGLKDYTFGHKVVIKGIRKNAIKLTESVYRQETWPSFKGLLKTGKAGVYEVKQTVKHLSRIYTKGVVQDSGQVRPFVSFSQDDILLSELLPVKKLLTDLETEILHNDNYINQTEYQQVFDSEIGLGGLYYVPKKYRGEVKDAIANYPALAFHITYDITKKGTDWTKAIQEGLLQRTGGTQGYMDISDFLERLGQALQSRQRIGKLNKKALITLQKSGSVYDKVLVTKYIMLTQEYTVSEINAEIKDMITEEI